MEIWNSFTMCVTKNLQIPDKNEKNNNDSSFVSPVSVLLSPSYWQEFLSQHWVSLYLKKWKKFISYKRFPVWSPVFRYYRPTKFAQNLESHYTRSVLKYQMFTQYYPRGSIITEIGLYKIWYTQNSSFGIGKYW